MYIPREVARESNPSVRLNELIIKITTIIEKIIDIEYDKSLIPNKPLRLSILISP